MPNGNETEERYKDLGEDPAKEQGGKIELPEIKVGYHPDYNQYLSEMGLDPTLSPYQQRRTAIPPMDSRDYYPGLAPQDVVVGQTSTPMGTFSLISPGAPLFPFAVLDAIESQKQAQEVADELKRKPVEINDLVHHTVNPSWNKDFVMAQNKSYENLFNNYKEKYGKNWAKELRKSGEHLRMGHYYKALKEDIDITTQMALDVRRCKKSKRDIYAAAS